MTERRLVAVSPTKLDVWQQCAFRFRLQYVDKVAATGQWAHRSLGNAVHAALRDWFDIEDQAERTDGAAGRLVHLHWSDQGFRDEEQSRHWREVTAGIVARYCREHPAPVPFSRERSLGALGEHVTLSGRIDRIDERDGELVIVDYKTGATVPTVEDVKVSRALAIYSIVAERSLRRTARVVQLHHVPSGVVVEHRHTDESLARHLSRADAMGRDMAVAIATGESAFATSPGPLCGWCDNRDRCPDSGQVPPQVPWAGLPTTEATTDSFPM